MESFCGSRQNWARLDKLALMMRMNENIVIFVEFNCEMSRIIVF
jgi:hypothetical protein